MRKLISILLVLILSTGLLLPAEAATGAILYQNYDVENSTVTCYGLPLPAGGELTVSYGSEKMTDATLSSIGQENIPITVYFLVDTASSLSDEVVQQQTDILTLISSYMGAEDTMILSTIDEAFLEGSLLTDKDARQTAIGVINRTGSWKTNLCTGIDAAVESLSGSTVCHTNRFLVILSDGHDDSLDTVNVDTLRQKIAGAHIPVFSLILGSAKGPATAKDIEALTRFSQASLGGSVCQLATDKVSVAQAAKTLWEDIQATSVIRFTPSSLNTEEDAQFLVRYEQDTTRFEDTLLVRAVDLSSPEAPADDETTAPTETDATDATQATEAVEPAEEAEDSGNLLLIGIAAGVVLIAAVVVILLLRRKKAASREAAAESTSDSPNAAPVSYAAPTEGLPVQGFSETQPVEGGIHVELVALLHPDVACNFPLAEGAETTLGRDARSSVVLNGTDRKLSGIHAGILWDGAHLLVRDKHSTNGTYLNGTPCAGDAWYLVENGATIQAGGYEYRVTYRESPATGR